MSTARSRFLDVQLSAVQFAGSTYSAFSSRGNRIERCVPGLIAIVPLLGTRERASSRAAMLIVPRIAMSLGIVSVSVRPENTVPSLREPELDALTNTSACASDSFLNSIVVGSFEAASISAAVRFR